MNQRIRSVLIVGGGTAGWLSASYLRRALPETVTIRLVESPNIGRIGVGEATLPTLARTLAFLGIEEDEWMPKVGATYKTAIKFVDWAKNPSGGQHEHYWHPFISRPEPFVQPYDQPWFPEIGRGFSLLQYALEKRLSGSKESIAEMMSATPALCVARRAPRHPTDPSRHVIAAYHIDAMAFADFLLERFVPRGVEHITADVVGVQLETDGSIASVQTEDGRRLEADLFIDCSGFSPALIGRALGTSFRSDKHRLLCDSALAIPCSSNPERDDIPPFTMATALRNGWSWSIPLMHRTGCGYVYSSAHTTPEAAEDELRAHLGPQSEGCEARHLKFRVGQSEAMWSKNCIAIGLSGSFLEPLESTGIFLVEYGLALLVRLFPDRTFDTATIDLYNASMRDMYEETRDFILLHYLASGRDDTPFWRDARTISDIPDSLRRKMALARERLLVLDELKLTIFRAFNYTCVLDGSRRLPQRAHPLLDQLGYEAGAQVLSDIATDTRARLEQLPGHYAFLSSMLERSPAHR